MPLHVVHPAGAQMSGAAAPAMVDDDFELIEMVNLPKSDTGVGGTIYISTMQGSHGPRVKWYPARAGRAEPCLTVTLEEPPQLVNNGLPHRVAQAAGAEVAAWVSLNRPSLVDFWENGMSWTRQEVAAFIDGLQKV